MKNKVLIFNVTDNGFAIPGKRLGAMVSLTAGQSTTLKLTLINAAQNTAEWWLVMRSGGRLRIEKIDKPYGQQLSIDNTVEAIEFVLIVSTKNGDIKVQAYADTMDNGAPTDTLLRHCIALVKEQNAKDSPPVTGENSNINERLTMPTSVPQEQTAPTAIVNESSHLTTLASSTAAQTLSATLTDEQIPPAAAPNEQPLSAAAFNEQPLSAGTFNEQTVPTVRPNEQPMSVGKLNEQTVSMVVQGDQFLYVVKPNEQATPAVTLNQTVNDVSSEQIINLSQAEQVKEVFAEAQNIKPLDAAPENVVKNTDAQGANKKQAEAADKKQSAGNLSDDRIDRQEWFDDVSVVIDFEKAAAAVNMPENNTASRSVEDSVISPDSNAAAVHANASGCTNNALDAEYCERVISKRTKECVHSCGEAPLTPKQDSKSAPIPPVPEQSRLLDEPGEYDGYVADTNNYYQGAESAGRHYMRVKKQLVDTFEHNEPYEPLISRVRDSYWVRVPYRDSFYVVGLVLRQNVPIYVCYALHADAVSHVDDSFVYVDGRPAHYILFQNADTGRIEKPDISELLSD